MLPAQWPTTRMRARGRVLDVSRAPTRDESANPMESSVIQSSAVEQRVRQVHLGTQRAALRLLGDATAGRRLGGPLTRPVQIGVAEVCAAEVEAG